MVGGLHFEEQKQYLETGTTPGPTPTPLPQKRSLTKPSKEDSHVAMMHHLKHLRPLTNGCKSKETMKEGSKGDHGPVSHKNF